MWSEASFSTESVAHWSIIWFKVITEMGAPERRGKQLEQDRVSGVSEAGERQVKWLSAAIVAAVIRFS